jgi:hypothetical protein
MKKLQDPNPLIENINTSSSKGIIFAWFLGLAIFSWFNSSVSLGMTINIILAVGGMFGSSILIGIPCSLVASTLNKKNTGKTDSNPKLFAVMGNVAALLSFGAAYLIVQILR